MTHEATLETAKSKAASFSGIPESTIDSWIAKAREELKSAYSSIESRFTTTSVSAIKKTPAKKVQ
jgi:hypothetical protein